MSLTDEFVKQLIHLYQPIKLLEEIGAVLEWDMNVNLPTSAGETRGQHMAFISEQLSDHWRNPQLVELLDDAKARFDDLDEHDQAAVRSIEHASQFYVKVSPAIVAELAQTTTEAFMAWQQARADDNFNAFAPHLEKIVALNKVIADKLGYEDNPYDALLDLYDQGLTSVFCSKTFADLQPKLTKLLSRIQSSSDYTPDSPLLGEQMLYAEQDQRQLSIFVLKKMGYDFTSGRIDPAAHPFSSGLGHSDVRVTTRYLPHDFRSSFAASMHEGGHALYTQGIRDEYADISLESELSFAVHESQSRFWENQVGRNPAFIQFMTPLFQAFFPEQLGEVGAETMVGLFNIVKPNFIRIEADEVTYCLHIIVRFELENELINGNLKVSDLPEAWRAKFKKYLGIVPQSDREGVLQDVHWSNGYIGYFPSYALGNLYAAQFTNQLKQEIDFEKRIGQGELGTIRSWLRENIHQYGSSYSAPQLLQRITGEPLNPQFFVDYLEEKFGGIYRLSAK